jgi:uncharacterized protein with PQ loop repeat
MLVSVRLDIVLILAQDGCTVWVERTIRSKIAVRHTRWISYVTLVMWNVVSVHLETVLVSVQDGYMVCAKRTIDTGMILDAPDGSPR